MKRILIITLLFGNLIGPVHARESGHVTIAFLHQWQRYTADLDSAYSRIFSFFNDVEELHCVPLDTSQSLTLQTDLPWTERLYSLNRLKFENGVDLVLCFSDAGQRPAHFKIEYIDVSSGRVMRDVVVSALTDFRQQLSSIKIVTDSILDSINEYGFPFQKGQCAVTFITDTSKIREVLRHFYHFQRKAARYYPHEPLFLKMLSVQQLPHDLCGLNPFVFKKLGTTFIVTQPDSQDTLMQCFHTFNKIPLPLVNAIPPFQPFLSSLDCYHFPVDSSAIQILIQTMIAGKNMENVNKISNQLTGQSHLTPLLYHLTLTLQSLWCEKKNPGIRQQKILDKLYYFLFQNIDSASIEGAWLYLNYANFNFQADRDSLALEYLDKTIPIFSNRADTMGLALALLDKARIHCRRTEWLLAQDTYMQALALARYEKDQVSVADILFQVGSLFEKVDKKHQALDYYKESARVALAVKDTMRIIQVYEHISLILRSNAQLDSARFYLNNIIGFTATLEDEPILAKVYFHLGTIAMKQNRFAEALDHFQHCSDFLEMTGDSLALARADNNSGACLFQLGELDQAGIKYASALTISRAVGDSAGVMKVNLNLGELRLKEKKYEEAHIHFDEAFRLARQLCDSTSMASILYASGLAYIKQGKVRSGKDEISKALQLSRLGKGEFEDEGELLLQKLEAIMNDFDNLEREQNQK